MRLVVSWLREFVDIKASADEIAGTLGLRGFEVASIEPLDGGDAVIDFEVTANRPDALSVVDRTLDDTMLVIADRDRAQAVAGVMGGAASEVSASTREIVFESAYFKPPSVRRTSKRLGLKTEASSRFERGADISIQVVA